MKAKTTMLLTLMALGTSALIVSAQDNNNNDTPPEGPGPRGPGMRGERPPPPAIFHVLDANHDGVIDADEIANASAALKTLDKNGDGKLTLQEAMGPRPAMRGGPGFRGNREPRNGAGGDDNNRPPGPPPGQDDGGNNPPDGPPPADN